MILCFAWETTAVASQAVRRRCPLAPAAVSGQACGCRACGCGRLAEAAAAAIAGQAQARMMRMMRTGTVQPVGLSIFQFSFLEGGGVSRGGMRRRMRREGIGLVDPWWCAWQGKRPSS